MKVSRSKIYVPPETLTEGSGENENAWRAAIFAAAILGSPLPDLRSARWSPGECMWPTGLRFGRPVFECPCDALPNERYCATHLEQIHGAMAHPTEH